MKTKLVPCEKPKDLDEQYVGNAMVVGDHTLITRYDKAGHVYEEDICCGRWYKLVVVSDKTNMESET